jgi:hypothetical protein
MKNDIKAIPGYKVYEYLLVLNPHEELRNKIMSIKKEFFETYKSSAAVMANRILPLSILCNTD